MKTRSRKVTKPATSKETPDANTSTAKELAPSVANPPHIFVLPKDASPAARIISLPDPASLSPTRYFVCPEKGFFEFTKIAAPKKACRSWLLAPERQADNDVKGDANEELPRERQDESYVVEKPDMFVATPVDPLFIILPMLSEGETGSYLTFSDFLYTTEREGLDQLQQLLRQSIFAGLEKRIEGRMETVCDCMDMGDSEDKMYQLSSQKLAAALAIKANRTAKGRLPASMEERFVKKALETPVLSVKREESNISIAAEDATPGAESQIDTAATSQASTSTINDTTASTPTTSVAVTPIEDKPSAAEDVTGLLRVRTALDFLIISYIPASLRTATKDIFKSRTSPIDFAPLDKHLEYVAGLKKQAQALRSLSDNISRKRSAEDDEDALDKAEAKRKKKEEEEIKKKNTSRGVQQLKKADTSGMKKLSSFFSKAPPKKKT